MTLVELLSGMESCMELKIVILTEPFFNIDSMDGNAFNQTVASYHLMRSW